MREKTCCFSGHRIIPVEEYAEIKRRLEEELIKLIDRGVCYFCAGGALGFDTISALTVLRLKERYPHIRLMLILPCRDQTRNWKRSDVEVFERILGQADKVVYTSESYNWDSMAKRNRNLVDNSSVCICYMRKMKGGTAYTVNYAVAGGIEVINIADKIRLLTNSKMQSNINNL